MFLAAQKWSLQQHAAREKKMNVFHHQLLNHKSCIVEIRIRMCRTWRQTFLHIMKLFYR